MYLILWEYHVPAERTEEFEALYRPDGDWSGLFHGNLGYVSTTLWRDDRNPSRYLVSDRWTSPEAYEAFKLEHGDAYLSLSERGRRLYRTESELGRFTVVE
jgi:heme-degrading monooxygenase HmoA